MSRKFPASVRYGGDGAVTATLDPDNPADDICPVCKTMRYLNKDMEFLINPECYHPMCSTCVNRIFNDGPNQCPYAGCHKTLRRRGFRAPYFGDLKVEREVDIRKRVATVFNQVEDDFTDLRAYNDYLEKVEDMVFELLNGSDASKARAEAKLSAYEQQHKAEIERNKRMRNLTDEKAKQLMAADEAAARLRRLEAFKEDEEERREKAKFQEEMLDGMTNAAEGHARQAVNRIILKKRGQNKAAAVSAASAASHLGLPGLSIRGLKEKRRPEDENKPYDPFGGLDLAPTRYHIDDTAAYRNEWLDIARGRDDMRVGGYSADEYLGRAVFEAFAGLGVFVSEELGGAAVATAEAALAAGDRMEVDDVF